MRWKPSHSVKTTYLSSKAVVHIEFIVNLFFSFFVIMLANDSMLITLCGQALIDSFTCCVRQKCQYPLQDHYCRNLYKAPFEIDIYTFNPTQFKSDSYWFQYDHSPSCPKSSTENNQKKRAIRPMSWLGQRYWMLGNGSPTFFDGREWR